MLKGVIYPFNLVTLHPSTYPSTTRPHYPLPAYHPSPIPTLLAAQRGGGRVFVQVVYHWHKQAVRSQGSFNLFADFLK